MFDKSIDLFPIKESYVFLSHCAVSPLYTEALKKECEISEKQNKTGGLVFEELYDKTLGNLRANAAKLLKTKAHNLSFIKNTTEGISMIANGYPFNEGDQIISYIHEYPANYYPWKLQEKRGAELILLPDSNGAECSYIHHKYLPHSWSMNDLEALVTDKTRIIAISHVQFTSGFACDLQKLGEFCKERDIDLVVDAAQSLGALPIYPGECNIAAIVSSGWKWLMGPIGTGLMYTSEKFRQKLTDVVVGAEVMIQGTDYLDHSWHPYNTGKRFEYSTSPLALAAALDVCIKRLPIRYKVEVIREEILRLQDLFIGELDPDRFTPLLFEGEPRSTILSIICNEEKGINPDKLVKALESRENKDRGVLCTQRGGYFRFAPHFCNTDEEIQYTAKLLNDYHL